MRGSGRSVERELPARVGLRMGVVWRGEGQAFMRQNANRPFEAFTVPTTIAIRARTDAWVTVTTACPIPVYDLAPELLSQPPVNVVRNVPAADSHYWTFDASWRPDALRAAGRSWPGSSTPGVRDQSATYSGQSVRNNTLPVTPNDLINAGSEGRHEFRTWSAKLHGTYDGPWGVRLTPLLRHQSGQPYGRTFSTTLSYGKRADPRRADWRAADGQRHDSRSAPGEGIQPATGPSCGRLSTSSTCSTPTRNRT